jgi:hypothetical protein
MKNVARSVFASGFAAFLVTVASIPTEAVAGNFDGSWSVVINTLRVDCGSSLRYGVRIVGNRVVSGGGNYSVDGAVAANGSIRVTVAEGGRSANGYGRLVGNSGSGVWRTSAGECSGQWAASRGGGW